MEEENVNPIEGFIRKSILTILNSRIVPNTKANSIINNEYSTKEPVHHELDEIFLDDYQHLGHNHNKKKTYTLEIFFQRKDTKILIEKWTFSFNDLRTNSKEDKWRSSINLSVLMRSILYTTRVLPAYSIFSKQGFNFDLDYKLYSNSVLGCCPMKNSSRVDLSVLRDTYNLNINVEYILKGEIFKMEEDIIKQKEKDSNLYKRQRCFSEDNANIKGLPTFQISYFEDADIKDNYFSRQNKKFSPFNMYSSTMPNKMLLVEDRTPPNNMEAISIIESQLSSNDLELNTFPSEPIEVEQIDPIEESGYSRNKSKKFKSVMSTLKHLRTSDTSSSKSDDTNSFELEIEDGLLEGQHGPKAVSAHPFMVEEVINKMSNLKSALKCCKCGTIDYFNLAKVFGQVTKEAVKD